MSSPTSTRSPQGEPSSESTGRSGPLAHLILNGTLAAVFATLFVRAGDLPSSMWEPLGSGSFPRLVLAALVAINLALILKEARTFAALAPAEKGLVGRWCWRHRLAFGVLALFSLYIFAVPMLGFALASLGFLLAGQWLLGARSGKALLIGLVVALVFSFGVDTLFRDVFVISLPRGLLG